VVEEVGPSAVGLQPGDEVFTYCRKHFIGQGTYAEQVVVQDSFVAHKPAGLTFEEAAAVPLAGLTAYQTLIRRLGVRPGETVLVHAAAGGVGHFAVQIAAAHGAYAIGTASRQNHDFVRSLGAVDCLDYQDDELPDHVDCALDTLGGETLERTLPVADRVCSIIQPISGPSRHYHYVRPDRAELDELAGMVAGARLRVELQETFPLEEVARAHEVLEDGHVRGKIVLTVS
jgi:NADPH:quinone reductase-like Zn-dependent oxidoreductase